MADRITIDTPHALGRAAMRRQIEGGIDKIIEAVPGGSLKEHRWIGDTVFIVVESEGRHLIMQTEVRDTSLRTEIYLRPLEALYAGKSDSHWQMAGRVDPARTQATLFKMGAQQLASNWLVRDDPALGDFFLLPASSADAWPRWKIAVGLDHLDRKGLAQSGASAFPQFGEALAASFDRPIDRADAVRPDTRAEFGLAPSAAVNGGLPGRRNGKLGGIAALAAAGTAGAIFFAVFLQSPRTAAPVPRPDRKIADDSLRLPRSMPVAAVSAVRDASPAAHRVESAALRRPAREKRVPTQAERALAEDEAAPRGPNVDPYAGRVAKRLTGRALQSAVIADRLATKEVNLRQLEQIQEVPDRKAGTPTPRGD